MIPSILDILYSYHIFFITIYGIPSIPKSQYVQPLSLSTKNRQTSYRVESHHQRQYTCKKTPSISLLVIHLTDG